MPGQESEKQKTRVSTTIIRGGKPTDVEAISMEKPDQVIADPVGVRDMDAFSMLQRTGASTAVPQGI
jgi:hypothetical protein